MKVIRKMTQEVDLVEKYLKLEILTKVSLIKTSLMAEAYTNGKIKQSMKVTGSMELNKAKENGLDPKENSMKAPGLMGKLMVLELLNSQI